MRALVLGCVRLLSAVLTCSLLTLLVGRSEAWADAARDQCAAEARAKVANYKATTTPEEHKAKKAGLVALVFAFGGPISGAAAAKSASDERFYPDMQRAYENQCLKAKGLVPLPASAPPSTAVSPAVKGTAEGRGTTNASSRATASNGKCACKQMTECSGAWVTMSCAELKQSCRDPRDSRAAREYVYNRCDQLKQLLGGF